MKHADTQAELFWLRDQVEELNKRVTVTADVNRLLSQVEQLNKRLEAVEHFLSPEELHNPFD